MILLPLLLGCPSPDDTGAGDTADSGDTGGSECVDATGDYEVDWWLDPEGVGAGEPTELWYTLYGRDGCPVDDVQQNHQRMVHTLVISRDLADFQHLHHEDWYEIDADVLRSATYHVPVTFPLAGDYRLVFDFAHENQYVAELAWTSIGGAPAQAEAPTVDLSTTRSVAGMDIELVWDTPPRAGYEAQWHVNITEGGEDVTDLVQYLGADAHCVMASSDVEWVDHTHAWFPGAENMTPGMEMDHLYPGPYVPFHYVFPAAGEYKMWVQFARASDPEVAYTVDFWASVDP